MRDYKVQLVLFYISLQEIQEDSRDSRRRRRKVIVMQESTMENYGAGEVEKLLSDVTLNIFNRLPKESVLQSRKVCRSWRNLISKPKIGLLSAVSSNTSTDSKVRLYYGEKYNEELIEDAEQCSYEALAKIDLSVIINHSYVGSFILRPYMVGSCNGLVCFHVYHHDICDPVYIFNPLTGECTHLPKIERRDASPITKNIVFGGFGYCQSTNKYKVIGIYYDEKYQVTGSSRRVGRVQVYTLGGGCGWRYREDISYDIRDSGVFAHGAVYWLDLQERRSTVVAFDLKDEKFRKIPSPLLHIPDEDFRIAGLRLLGGNLCVYHTDECKFVDIWTHYRENNSWKKEFSIILENSNVDWPVCHPLAFLNSNEILLQYNGNISLYDPKTSTLKKIWEDVSNKTAIQSIPHMHSLVSPEALDGVRSNRGAYSSLPHWLRSSWIIFFPILIVLLKLLLC